MSQQDAAKKSAAPAKAAPQTTVTLKHLAAVLSDSHDLPKKQAEAVLGDLVTHATKHLLNGLGILQVRKRAARMGGTRRPAKPTRSRPARRLRSGRRRN
jgi:DNA-binding protein HU-beta